MADEQELREELERLDKEVPELRARLEALERRAKSIAEALREWSRER